MLRYSEFVKRCSAHALDDPKEIKTFFDDLMATGRELGVPMPVMSSYAEDIAQFVEMNQGISCTAHPGQARWLGGSVTSSFS
jgi:hypothetical protein